MVYRNDWEQRALVAEVHLREMQERNDKLEDELHALRKQRPRVSRVLLALTVFNGFCVIANLLVRLLV